MTRMTEKELAALERAKLAPVDFNDIPIQSTHKVRLDAQRLRAEFIREQFRALSQRLRSALGLDQRAEQARMRRLYRETVRELSRLDSHELRDLGIGRGGIEAAARKAVGLPESEEPGFFTRLRKVISDAAIRRRTARELARLDSRMLNDIVLNRGHIHDYLNVGKDLVSPHPHVAATPYDDAVALSCFHQH